MHEKLFSRVEHEERVEVLDRINRIGHWTGSGSGRRKCRDDECVANIYSETYTEGSDPLEPWIILIRRQIKTHSKAI